MLGVKIAMYSKNNLKSNEETSIILSLFVNNGIGTGFSGKIPGYLVNKLEDVIEEIVNYTPQLNEKENAENET